MGKKLQKANISKTLTYFYCKGYGKQLLNDVFAVILYHVTKLFKIRYINPYLTKCLPMHCGKSDQMPLSPHVTVDDPLILKPK